MAAHRGLSLIFAMAALIGTPAAANPKADLAAPFEAAMDRLVQSEPSMPGVIMAVSAPRLGLEWSGAKGSLTRGGAEPLRRTDAFRIASVTKVYVAATALRAIEEGRFRLHDPIRPLISRETAATLERGGYDLDAITVEQLLNHTSGLFDFATTDEWSQALAADPKRAWTRAEEVAFAVDHGHKMSEAGAEYHYSDTSYLVAGEIIERSMGLSLPAASRLLIGYGRLGLTKTHFEKLEAAPAGERRSHQYVGDVDATGADPSFDLYGGGGIVTTADDLIRFIRPLLQGDVFKDRSTLSAALILPAVPSDGRSLHAPLLSTSRLGARQCWSHGGYWGVLVAYCPDLDLAVAVSVGQSKLGPPGSPHGATGRAIAGAVGEAIDEMARRAATRPRQSRPLASPPDHGLPSLNP